MKFDDKPNRNRQDQTLLKLHQLATKKIRPNKPKKYGIKFWVIVDVNSKYVSHIVPYLKAQEVDGCGGIPLAESIVMKLAHHHLQQLLYILAAS